MKMVTFTVRAAELGDAWEIGRLQVRASQEAFRGIVPDERLRGLVVRQRGENWEERMRHGVAGLFIDVAQGERELLGFCNVDQDAPASVPEIRALFVDPGVLRAKVGRALLFSAFDRLRESGFGAVRVSVFVANRPGRAFVSRYGFEADGSERTDEDGVAAVRMWRSLTGPNDPLMAGLGAEEPGGMASSEAPSENQE
jgi:GNAT superfamily N-acetyltransferase